MAFIAEDDAIRIIREEAAKAGLVFAGPARSIADLELPATSEGGSFEERQRRGSGVGDLGPLTVRSTLVLDGTDEKQRVSFEFVSKLDVAHASTGGRPGA